MVGRQADVIELSAANRTFLESQVRRRKAPRSLSDRCRMVLLCADGLQSKEVAERLGVHEHTVGKWRWASWRVRKAVRGPNGPARLYAPCRRPWRSRPSLGIYASLERKRAITL